MVQTDKFNIILKDLTKRNLATHNHISNRNKFRRKIHEFEDENYFSMEKNLRSLILKSLQPSNCSRNSPKNSAYFSFIMGEKRLQIAPKFKASVQSKLPPQSELQSSIYDEITR